MTLRATLRHGVAWLFTQTSDLDVRQSKLTAPDEVVLEDGTGASQANSCFADTRTLAISANEDLDLAGALLDAFGNTLTFTKIKAIYIRAADANTNSVIIKPAAANGFLGPFANAAHTQTLPPGGVWQVEAPVNGWAVTAGTGDKINIANSAAGTSVTYDIEIIGTV
jgi:hypothetical protein